MKLLFLLIACFSHGAMMAEVRPSMGVYQLPNEFPSDEASIRQWATDGFSRYPVFDASNAPWDLLRKYGLMAECYRRDADTVDWIITNGHRDLVAWFNSADEPNPDTYPAGGSLYNHEKTDLQYVRANGFKVMVNLSAFWLTNPETRYATHAAPYYQGWGADICGADFYPFYWRDPLGMHQDGDWRTSAVLAQRLVQYNPGKEHLWYMEGAPWPVTETGPMDIYLFNVLWPDPPKEWMVLCATALRNAGVRHINLFYHSVGCSTNCSPLTYNSSRWNTIRGAVQEITGHSTRNFLPFLKRMI